MIKFIISRLRRMEDDIPKPRPCGNQLQQKHDGQYSDSRPVERFTHVDTDDPEGCGSHQRHEKQECDSDGSHDSDDAHREARRYSNPSR